MVSQTQDDSSRSSGDASDEDSMHNEGGKKEVFKCFIPNILLDSSQIVY